MASGLQASSERASARSWSASRCRVRAIAAWGRANLRGADLQEANLTGAKHGCYSGDCGSCTVIADGQAVLSCQLTIAAAEGADITTIEGLSADRAHPLQQAWATEQVSQCGRCDPGFIMALAALMRATPNPTPDQLSALPNICRCGATPRIMKAIAKAAATSAPAIPDPSRAWVQPPPSEIPANDGEVR